MGGRAEARGARLTRCGNVSDREGVKGWLLVYAGASERVHGVATMKG